MNLNRPVWEIMTTDLVTVADTDSIEEIKPLIERRGFHHLPVENNTGTIAGIISSEDFSRAAFFPVPEDKLLAKHIMTVSAEAIDMQTPLKKVVDKFLTKRFRALPIINEDKILVGIVTPYDIMKVLMAHFKGEEISSI